MPQTLDDRTRRLPQGCQVETPYSDEEWRSFLKCAREGFDSGKGLHNEFGPKIHEHDVPEREVRLALHSGAALVAYTHWGMGRVAIWDRDRTGLRLIADKATGLIFNAFDAPTVESAVAACEDVRWLYRP